jgi:hypothetical protein
MTPWALYWVLLLILPHVLLVIAAPGSCSVLNPDQLQSGKDVDTIDSAH